MSLYKTVSSGAQCYVQSIVNNIVARETSVARTNCTKQPVFIVTAGGVKLRYVSRKRGRVSP